MAAAVGGKLRNRGSWNHEFQPQRKPDLHDRDSAWGPVQLGPVYGPLVVVAAYPGLRPSEWAALEWRDVDRNAGVLTIERAFSYGQVKPLKTKGSRRRVPLPARAAEVLEHVPRRLDTRLVFPRSRGAHIDLRNWRKREWKPALEAAGLPRERRPYDLRHSFASWARHRRPGL